MKFWLKTSRLAYLLGAILLAPAAAQAVPPRFAQAVPDPVTVREAFAAPYGQVIVDALEKALRKSADPACLADKKIAPDQLRRQGETLLVRQGQARIDRMLALVDADKADAEFTLRGGPTAHDEWRALQTEPTIAEYNRLSRPAQLISLVDSTAENFGRYVLLRRIKLDEINPLATGDEKILALGEETSDAAIEAAEAVRKANDTPAMQRFLELAEWVAEALQAAVDQTQLLRYGPSQWMAGLDEDLRALCIDVK
jgi:hypothetical protein